MAPAFASLLQEAVRLHQRGQLLDAERLYRSALAEQPKNFDALYLLAMLKMQQSRIQEAAELASAAVERNPGSADALMLLGSLMLTLKRTGEALDCFDRAVAAQPRNPDARYNRAVALGEAGRLTDAVDAYDQVVAAQPNNVAAWYNRGNALAALGRHDAAVGCFDRVLALAPRHVDALNNRGSALAAVDRHEAALASFDAALVLAPEHVEALTNRAISLKALERLEEALASCRAAIGKDPGHVRALMTEGNVLHALERYDEALVAYDRALSLAPADLLILNNRGINLLEMGCFHAALANAERTISLYPADAEAYFGRAKALHALARYDEAIDDYREAIELKPAFAEAQWNLSVCCLCRGKFAEGWTLYESRWAPGNATSPPRGYTQPRWGGNALPGTLLLWGDQGLGDQIIYASMIPEAQRRADQLVLEVAPRLVALYARSFPGVQVVAAGDALYAGHVDAQLPLSSLPRLLRPDWDAFPRRNEGYLIPDAERVQEFRQRLAGDGRIVVGLTWISRNPKIGRFKSAHLKDIEALLRMPNVRFVDLQYGDTAAERQMVERDLGVRIEHLDDVDTTNDIDGMAALSAACDAVLSVSSTTAHLAGAVGARTFVMVPFGRGHLWYWFVDRPVSPWYPRVQVRRQAEEQSWSELVRSLVPDVMAAAKEGPPSPP